MTKIQLRWSVLEQMYRVHISCHSDADSQRVQSSDPPARLGVVCACASLAGVRGAAVNKGGQEHDVLAPRSQNFVSSDISIKSGTKFGRRGGLEEQSSSLAGFYKKCNNEN